MNEEDEELMGVFEEFTSDDKYIRLEDLRGIAQQLNENITDEELKHMLTVANMENNQVKDKDKDTGADRGSADDVKVDRDSFKRVLSKACSK